MRARCPSCGSGFSYNPTVSFSVGDYQAFTPGDRRCSGCDYCDATWESVRCVGEVGRATTVFEALRRPVATVKPLPYDLDLYGENLATVGGDLLREVLDAGLPIRVLATGDRRTFAENVLCHIPQWATVLVTVHRASLRSSSLAGLLQAIGHDKVKIKVMLTMVDMMGGDYRHPEVARTVLELARRVHPVHAVLDAHPL